MAKHVGTIAELKKLLAQREKELVSLKGMRKRLTAQLRKVETRIAELKGRRVTGGRRAPAKARRGRPRKVAGKKTLRQAVAEVLGGSRKGLRAKDIAEALPGVGYISRSKNLLTTIGSLLSRRPEFQRVARGKYKLRR